VRNDVQRKLLTLSPSFFDAHPSGALISRITNDSLLVRLALTDAVAAVLRDSVRVIALLAAALYLDPLLGSIVLIAFPIGFLPIIKFGKKVRRLSREGQDQLGNLTAILQESLAGHRVVQAFSLEEHEHARFRAESDRMTKVLQRAEKYGALAAPTNEIAASFAIAGVILYGGFSVIGGVRTQGDFMAFITSVFLLYDPLKRMGRVNNIFQAGIAAAERIFEVLDAAPAIAEKENATDLERFRPDIAFRNVSFRYPKARGDSPEAGEGALSNVTLTIGAGQTLALVGMSGGGKSTLVNLLPRFHDPDSGSISIGGRDTGEVTLASLRRNIAIVGQHTFLFNDTVRNNIRFGRLDATDQEIEEAAHSAYAFDFISRLPDGFETAVGEQGLRLSGGERARIAIARALLKDAPILILDEATAALDSEAEREVQQAIERLMERRTVIVIAHRLATVRRADKIAVLVRGRVVEEGTHGQLLAKGGEYAKLYRMQFRDEAVLDAAGTFGR
jgi:subfamily B ATP-binding cassette protein MsbA